MQTDQHQTRHSNECFLSSAAFKRNLFGSLRSQFEQAIPAVFFTILVGFSIGCGQSKPPEKKSIPTDRIESKPTPKPQTKPTKSSESINVVPEKNNTTKEETPTEPDSIQKSLTGDREQNAQQATKLPATFRPSDVRPIHDDEKLSRVGIRKYSSDRLILYTDIDPGIARTLPPIIDQAYLALVDYFGPLPPDREAKEFQMTGYLIKNEALFRDVGLIPEDLPTFAHGRHRRNEFWMREQNFDYYRRHLMIHEVTHCFMTVMPDVDAPVWYMEGMAEYFGTHRILPDGKVQFRVMPSTPEEFAGFGRINLIKEDYAADKGKTVSMVVMDQPPQDFLKDYAYSWSWALCHFLDTNPKYQERFRGLKGLLHRNSLVTQFRRVFSRDEQTLGTEWFLFIKDLQYGYDTVQASVDFHQGDLLDDSQPEHSTTIKADCGWQSSGVLLEKGKTYEISASGRFELANQPKPWLSEPQGITFRYFNGRPLGLLLGSIRSESGDELEIMTSMKEEFPIGRGGSFQAPRTGTLYLRLNDDWSLLADNKGEASVSIRTKSSN